MAFRLLVTLDGSGFSERILDSAVRLAGLTTAEVYLLRVVGPAREERRPGENFDPRGESEGAAMVGERRVIRMREVESATQAAERLEAEARDYLTEPAKRFAPADTHLLVRHGSHPADEILRCAEEIGADLIAMATHGRTGVGAVVAGSVAAAVLRAGKTPVMLIRPAV